MPLEPCVFLWLKLLQPEMSMAPDKSHALPRFSAPLFSSICILHSIHKVQVPLS